jgi:hypothetical protein
MRRRAFGGHTKVLSATELGAGLYNATLRIAVAGQERPVILPIAEPLPTSNPQVIGAGVSGHPLSDQRSWWVERGS